MEAIREVVDAAGALEYSRENLRRLVALAQQEFGALVQPPYPATWAGINTPPVYYAFSEAVAWTRTVEDRFEDRLRPAVVVDRGLWNRLKVIRRATARAQFDDARLLAKCGLHKFTPPYDNAPASVQAGILIYPVIDHVVDPNNIRANLSFAAGRQVLTVVDEYWNAIGQFVDAVLAVLYPRAA
jgi:hypothetical protein